MTNKFKAIRSNLSSGGIYYKVANHDVHIQHVYQRQENGLAVIDITGVVTGVVGNHIEKHKWTIGSVDGQRPAPDTLDELQAKLDSLREAVAVAAAWKEENHQNSQKLV